MNNLKKLKLLVASALLSSTAVYADDCINGNQTNCGVIITGSQTIDIDRNISTTNKRGINIFQKGEVIFSIDGNISTNSNITSAAGITIDGTAATNNVINMIGNIETTSSGGAEQMHGIRLTGGASNNTVNVTGNVSTSGNISSGILT